MSAAVIWSKSKPDVEFRYGGRLGECHGLSSQSHVSHCRVLALGEFTLMILEPHATFQGVMIQSVILKIVFRHILFFNSVWALTSAGFRIVSYTLVKPSLPTATAASCDGRCDNYDGGNVRISSITMFQYSNSKISKINLYYK